MLLKLCILCVLSYVYVVSIKAFVVFHFSTNKCDWNLEIIHQSALIWKVLNLNFIIRQLLIMSEYRARTKDIGLLHTLLIMSEYRAHTKDIGLLHTLLMNLSKTYQIKFCRNIKFSFQLFAIEIILLRCTQWSLTSIQGWSSKCTVSVSNRTRVWRSGLSYTCTALALELLLLHSFSETVISCRKQTLWRALM